MPRRRGRRNSRRCGYVGHDAEELPGAIRPSGAYRVRGQKLTTTVVLVRDQRKLKQIRVEGSTQDLDALTGRIVTDIDRAVAAIR